MTQTASDTNIVIISLIINMKKLDLNNFVDGIQKNLHAKMRWKNSSHKQIYRTNQSR